MQARTGSFIGATAGLLFIAVSAGVLPDSWPLILRSLGFLAASLIAGIVIRSPAEPPAADLSIDRPHPKLVRARHDRGCPTRHLVPERAT